MLIPAGKKAPPDHLALAVVFARNPRARQQAHSDFQRWARHNKWTDRDIRRCFATLTRPGN